MSPSIGGYVCHLGEWVGVSGSSLKVDKLRTITAKLDSIWHGGSLVEIKMA